jgi:predicted enzyme related to lactoylglutathione lyase
MEGIQPEGSGTLSYFSCEDCNLEQARVEPAGGRVLQSKMKIGDSGFIAIGMGTEGT